MVSERCWQNSISDVIIEIKDGEECRRPNENKTKFRSHFAGATSKRLVKIHLKLQKFHAIKAITSFQTDWNFLGKRKRFYKQIK